MHITNNINKKSDKVENLWELEELYMELWIAISKEIIGIIIRVEKQVYFTVSMFNVG